MVPAVEYPEIRVFVAGEEPLFSNALCHALSRQPGFRVVGETSDGLDAVSETARVHPDVVVLDSNLPRCSAVEVTRMLRERRDACRIVVLTSSEDGDVLARAVEAGANGYLTKGAALAELVQTARAVHTGETQIPSGMLGDLLRTLVDAGKERQEASTLVDRLSEREKRVLALLAEGASNRTIAEILTISPQTVRTHVQNILRKLEVHSRLEAAALATKLRL